MKRMARTLGRPFCGTPAPGLLGAFCASLTLISAIGGGCLSSSSTGEPGSVDVTDLGDVPDPDAKFEKPAAARRLTVDELQASIAVVAGNDAMGAPIHWKAKGKEALSNEVFGRTLGRPDYIGITDEDSAPSPLYVKFSQDMARDVCNLMVKADLARTAGQKATLWGALKITDTATAQQIDSNLNLLALRFWGFDETEIIDVLPALRKVFDAGVATDDPKDTVPAQASGWKAVCVAMFEDPAFHLR